MSKLTDREQIIEVCNRLFIYTDERSWDQLLEEVFAEEVLFDNSSLGGGPAATQPARAITDMWQQGLAGIDAVHHQSGNYLVDIDGERAEVFCYATATHYLQAARNGRVRSFVGSYNLGCRRTAGGWRIDSFKYNLKYQDGNLELK